MIEFRSGAVYTLEEIESALDGLSCEQFLKVLGIKRRFQKVILGADVVAALERVEGQDEHARVLPIIRTGKRGRPRKAEPVRKIRLKDVLDFPATQGAGNIGKRRNAI
ncbi:MAG: hypothetical protein WCK47_11730 [bacterium]